MKVAIIISKVMPAALNIKEKLLKQHSFSAGKAFEGNETYKATLGSNEVTIYTIEENAVRAENIDKKIDCDVIIFPTTHKSSAGVASLTCHVPGNWGKAELGGKEKTICKAPAELLKQVFLELNKNRVEGFEVSVEQTHHGPCVEKPVMFAEIGSSEKEWKNDAAGEAVAKSIIAALSSEAKTQKCVIILGGQHYNQAANKVLLNTKYAVSHICAKHCLQDLDEGMLQQAIAKSTAEFEMVVLDWKGLGQHKQKVKTLIEKLGLKSERTNKLP